MIIVVYLPLTNDLMIMREAYLYDLLRYNTPNYMMVNIGEF